MRRVTSTEFQQAVGTYSDEAIREPVVITAHNRDRLVLLDVNEYNRLKGLDSDGELTQAEKDELRAGAERHRHTITELAKR